AAFSEDPLRVLRGFQFAARFDLVLAPETAALCRSIRAAYAELPIERVWGEWAKWAEKSQRPSRGLDLLEETQWLAHFPELAALRGTLQDPAWHPEGDVLAHTAHCCDALVRIPDWTQAAPERRRALLLAVLAHDLGKPATTRFGERRGQLRWISPGHEAAGGPVSDAFLARVGAPRDIIDFVRPLVINHLAHHNGQHDFPDSSLRRLARRLVPASIDDLCLVMRADHDGRPPVHSPEVLARIELLRSRAAVLAIEHDAPRPILLGRHLIAAGLEPGAHFRAILDAAFEAQLEGVFADEAGAHAWLETYLKNPPAH
ncbi:MAG: HD domain-containing protein, partial [Opitutaceae bacterium]|nr:HD domain-containing protein [Opitutaceae bacterium]